MDRVGLKAYAGMFFLVVAFCGSEVLAQTHHLVGGDDGWSSDLNVSSWLVGRVFRVGDKIWFMYPAAEGTIAELGSKEELEACDVANPIRMYTDGLNDVILDKEGTRYFTSGNVENCRNGMRLPVPVQTSPYEPEAPAQPEPFQPDSPTEPTPPESLPPFQPEAPFVPPPPEPFPIPPPSASPPPPPPPESWPPVEPEPPLVPTPPEPYPIQPPSASPPPPPESSPPVQPEPPLMPTPPEPFPIHPPSASPPPPPESPPPVKPEPPLVPTPPEPLPVQPPSATPPPPPSAATATSNVLSFVFYGSILSYFVL